MMRLIDADELLTVTDIREDGSEVTYVLYDDIENAPTIERPRGEWVIDGALERCSYCSGIKNQLSESFCANCGAEMESFWSNYLKNKEKEVEE